MTKKELAARIERLQKENADLEQENAALNEQLKAAENTVRRAKDISPIVRPSLGRVFKLVREACMTLTRKANGWLLKFGARERKFKKLTEIWELLLAEEWQLCDIFPEQELEEAPREKTWRDLNGFLPKPVLRFPQRNKCLAPNYHPRPEILIPF